ncbi:uncharacterized protein SOCEGT47_017530 [Sorangium cellulosum]|uniref:Uncharacterized protein n=1 Tax=Sorangium cellulosum TaxID=56 RepID=A0A4V0ND33_SORCE|nr:hypothetical protein [Sorangium cellulosum]AUX21272.1 uncharacterized protein SOCEGT47_017530 [Sorangium cellulosum]
MSAPVDIEVVSFAARPAHRWRGGDTWLEEQVVPSSRRILGECHAAVYRFGGDVEVAAREAAHATILRALADAGAEACDGADLRAGRLAWEAFLRGESGRPGLVYALFEGPYHTSLDGHRHEVAVAWLAGLFDATLSPDELELREWTTDGYDPWFRWGREWWGTFLWTAAWAERGLLVGITASSTD